MYARNLAEYLHKRLGDLHRFNDTLTRFERLRSYRLLPKGRENAATRLSDAQIASAVLGFATTQSGGAGHVALLLGNLKPVGGASASFAHQQTLQESVAILVSNEEACHRLISLTLSIGRMDNDHEYHAYILFDENGKRRIASYVSKLAYSLLHEGAEASFDHARPRAPSARELTLGRDFFLRLHREVALSRRVDRPLRTDWREYENEEERNNFHARLGARNNSYFLNVGVDTTVTWPSEPTRIPFGGHHLVLFPKTKENSHSVSIDLQNEKLTWGEAQTLINRFLSLLSWCDDQHAIMRWGDAGNPVPVPVQRRDWAFATAPQWAFGRKLPTDGDLLQRLAYYREGLNAREAGSSTYEFLTFYKVFETRETSKPGQANPTKSWIRRVFVDAAEMFDEKMIERFHSDRGNENIEDYIVHKCRVAAAHASMSYPSDPDANEESRRLAVAGEVVRVLARYYIRHELGFSDSWFEVEERSEH